jgi:hypothetical protein
MKAYGFVSPSPDDKWQMREKALRQPLALTSSDLLDHRVRSEKLTMLYQELHRIRRVSFKEQLRPAS